MMNEMNYRYNNKNTFIPVDLKLAEAFVSKERTPEQIERFSMWADMSKEANVIKPVLGNVVVLQTEKVKQAA